MLKPNNAWKWYFDSDSKSLMLELGDDMVFRVAIAAKQLIPDAFNDVPFSVEDASLFQIYSNAIGHLPLSGPRKAELALNAVAANRFHKPLLPKSWFFDSQESRFSPESGTVVQLTTSFGSEPFLVIENAGSASLCMLASESPLMLTENKTMAFCDAIKVMNDRLSPFQIQDDSSSGLFALVG